MHLVESMIRHSLSPSSHPDSAVAALSAAASRPDWQCLEDVDVPLKQHSLCITSDEALHPSLLLTAPSTRACALALSSALPHVGDWLDGVPSASQCIKGTDLSRLLLTRPLTSLAS